MRNRDEDRKRLKNMERSIEEIIKNQQAEKFREKI